MSASETGLMGADRRESTGLSAELRQALIWCRDNRVPIVCDAFGQWSLYIQVPNCEESLQLRMASQWSLLSIRNSLVFSFPRWPSYQSRIEELLESLDTLLDPTDSLSLRRNRLLDFATRPPVLSLPDTYSRGELLQARYRPDGWSESSRALRCDVLATRVLRDGEIDRLRALRGDWYIQRHMRIDQIPGTCRCQARLRYDVSWVPLHHTAAMLIDGWHWKPTVYEEGVWYRTMTIPLMPEEIDAVDYLELV